MADNGKQKSSCAIEEGHSSESGQEFDPFALRKEDAEQGAHDEIHIPIGSPISSRDYKGLKERARNANFKPPPSGVAQEDKTR